MRVIVLPIIVGHSYRSRHLRSVAGTTHLVMTRAENSHAVASDLWRGKRAAITGCLELLAMRGNKDGNSGGSGLLSEADHATCRLCLLAQRLATALAASRSRCTSRSGGTPKRLLYSRLKWE